MRAKVEKGDTVVLGFLNPVYVTENWNPRQKKRFTRKYLKLIRDVKKAYPYAKLAGNKLNEYEGELAAIESKGERRRFLNKVENELRNEYEGDLKSLTITQGVILIKLVDRETGDTSFELVKQFRGSFSAFFWQSLARLFGHNLKLNYDPHGEDYLIEEVIQLIESGKV
ncbi:MAG: DUF4294 domain-containing protein [Vicingaceae bacterium]